MAVEPGGSQVSNSNDTFEISHHILCQKARREPYIFLHSKETSHHVPTSAPWKVILTQSTRQREVHGVIFPAYRVADLAGVKCRLVLWSDDSF